MIMRTSIQCLSALSQSSDYSNTRTRVNVPIVMNVSFLFILESLLYIDFTASLIPAFLFASSIAKLLAKARFAAAILGLMLGGVTLGLFFDGRSASVGAPFRFLAFFGGSSKRRRSSAARNRASSSGVGFRRIRSSELSNLVEHCGQTSSCLPVASGSICFSWSFPFMPSSLMGGVGVAPETVLSPACDRTQPQGTIYRNGW